MIVKPVCVCRLRGFVLLAANTQASIYTYPVVRHKGLNHDVIDLCRFDVLPLTDCRGSVAGTETGRYGDSAGNTVEENSSVFSLIRMC